MHNKILGDYQSFKLRGDRSIQCKCKGNLIGDPRDVEEKEARVIGVPKLEDGEYTIEVNNVIFNATVEENSLESTQVLSEFLDDSYNLDDIDSFFENLDAERFEHLLAFLFEKAGWRTNVTSYTNDRGIDVEARKQYPIRRKYLIQAKCNSKGNNVSAGKVRDYNSLKDQENNVDQVILATTSDFTAQAREISQKLDIKLLNREDLKRMIKDVQQYEEKGVVEIKEESQSNYNTFAEVPEERREEIKKNKILEDSINTVGDEGEVSIEKVIEYCQEEHNLDEKVVKDTIDRLKRDGELYEPRQDHIQAI